MTTIYLPSLAYYDASVTLCSNHVSHLLSNM